MNLTASGLMPGPGFDDMRNDFERELEPLLHGFGNLLECGEIIVRGSVCMEKTGLITTHE